jgi:hypothetical protein
MVDPVMVINPGDVVAVVGWMVVVTDSDGKQHYGCIFPNHTQAHDYARAYYRGRDWRLLPCAGTSQTAACAIGESGLIQF